MWQGRGALCVHRCMCMCTRVQAKGQPTSDVLPRVAIHLDFWDMFSVSWNTTIWQGQQTPGVCLSLCLPGTRIKSVCHSSRLTLFLTWVAGMEPMSFFPLHHLPSQGCIIFYRALWLQMLTDTLDVQSSLWRLVNACLDHSSQCCWV